MGNYFTQKCSSIHYKLTNKKTELQDCVDDNETSGNENKLFTNEIVSNLHSLLILYNKN